MVGHAVDLKHLAEIDHVAADLLQVRSTNRVDTGGDWDQYQLMLVKWSRRQHFQRSTTLRVNHDAHAFTKNTRLLLMDFAHRQLHTCQMQVDLVVDMPSKLLVPLLKPFLFQCIHMYAFAK